MEARDEAAIHPFPKGEEGAEAGVGGEVGDLNLDVVFIGVVGGDLSGFEPAPKPKGGGCRADEGAAIAFVFDGDGDPGV